jgi:hypothetical protein
MSSAGGSGQPPPPTFPVPIQEDHFSLNPKLKVRFQIQSIYITAGCPLLEALGSLPLLLILPFLALYKRTISHSIINVKG